MKIQPTATTTTYKSVTDDGIAKYHLANFAYATDTTAMFICTVGESEADSERVTIHAADWVYGGRGEPREGEVLVNAMRSKTGKTYYEVCAVATDGSTKLFLVHNRKFADEIVTQIAPEEIF